MSKIIESPHPYENNQDVFTVVEMPGATGYIVSFDEQSCTEEDCDYVRFYRNDDHLEFWGEDKYSGGRGGSSKNFPGTGGRPALTIPAGRFVVHFHSDEGNTDWGYKFFITKSADPTVISAVALCGRENGRISVGARVVLAKGYGSVGDADEGPLKPGDVGVLVQDDKSDKPYKVRVAYDRTWWYRLEAICLESEEDLKAPTGIVEFPGGLIIESPHPYENNQNMRTVVEMPGATGYIVSFDEQSCTELNCDYVRFFKNDNNDSFWGEDKYSGGRGGSSKNFPGTGGRPALTIPAGRFVVHFHSDGSNTDWGYKITVTKSNCGRENGRICVGARVVLAKGYGSMGDAGEGPLKPGDVGVLVQDKKSDKPYKVRVADDGAWLYRLEAICLESEEDLKAPTGIVEFPGGLIIESPHPYENNQNMRTVVEIPGATGYTVSFDKQSCTERNCDYVRFYKDGNNNSFWGEGKYSGGYQGSFKNFPGTGVLPALTIPAGRFVVYFHSDGSTTDWGYKITVKKSTESLATVAVAPCGRENDRICVGARVVLAKGYGSMGDAEEGPLKPGDVGIVVEDDKSDNPYKVRVANDRTWWYRLEAICLESEEDLKAPSNIVEIPGGLITESPHPYENNQDVYTVVEMSGAIEYIVSFDEQSCTERNCDYVRFYKDDNHDSFWGEDKYSGGFQGSDKNFPGTGGRPALTIPAGRFVVHFHSDGSNTDWGYKITVKRANCGRENGRICVGARVVLAKGYGSVGDADEGPLKPGDVGVLVQDDKSDNPYEVRVADDRTWWYRLEAICLESEENLKAPPGIVEFPGGLIIESPHPYENNLDVYTVVEMPGATGYVVSFDEQSRTEEDCDYVRFYRNDDHLEFWGEDKYSGGRGGSSKNFPGTGGRPALTIPAGRFVVYFHSDGRTTDWGYMILITKSNCGRENGRICVGARVVLAKGYGSVGDASDGPLKPGDVGVLVQDDKSDKPYKVRVADDRTWWYRLEAICLESEEDLKAPSNIVEFYGGLIIESPHPYENNQDVYTVVEMPGAIEYIVSFDEQSRTEEDCDYVRFYKDSSHDSLWGENKYSGGYQGSFKNFPGTGFRPALTIPAGRFVVHFHSDGSTMDWGYKITVKKSNCGRENGRICVGARVVLAKGYGSVGDASDGPLKPGDVGFLVQDDKSDKPYKVRVADG
eukprot:gene1742-2043_t